MPLFFLSYAQADADGHLQRFYRDLCESVRARTGLPTSDVGFLDESNQELGTSWEDNIAQSIASAHVFVAMCSPSYFASDFCGREWQMFAELDREQPPGGRTANIIPVTWVPTRVVPDVARQIQHFDFGEAYRHEGLNYLSRLRRFRDSYDLIVGRLASQIADAGRAGPPPRPLAIPSLADTPNAFLLSSASESGHEQDLPAPPLDGGPRHVNFVVVAAEIHELTEIRLDTTFYGPTPFDWSPYRPYVRDRIVVRAQSIASAKDLTSSLSAADGSIVDLLSRSRDRNEIVVLIVDVWTAKLPRYRSVLLEYDKLNVPTSAIMIPWNEADRELQERSEELHTDLDDTLPNNVARGDSVFRRALATDDVFKLALEEVLAEIQSRIFMVGRVTRRAGGDRIVERPMLTRPSEGSYP